MKKACVALALVLLAVGLVSCRDKKLEEAYRNETARAEQLAMEGNPGEAIKILATMAEAEPFRSYRPELLNRLVSLAWMAGDADTAVKYFRTGLETAPASMEGMVGMMIDQLSARQPGEPFVAWCVSLEGVTLGAAARQSVGVAHAKALCSLGRAAEALKVAEQTMGKLPAPDAMNMARTMSGILKDAGLKKEAGEIPAVVERAIPASPDRKGLLCDLRMALLIEEGRVDDALALYRGEIAAIPDGNVISGMQALAKALPDGGDALGEELMVTCAKRQGPREAAARHWIRKIRERKDVPGMGSRLIALREKGFPDAFVAGQMDVIYSEFVGSGNVKAQAPVYAMFESILKDSKDETLRRRAAGFMLDMGFFLEKYAESLALVESDLFKEDERVSNGLLSCKIKAHLALQQGRVDDAVKNFRDFMGLIGKQMMDREMDPLDNSWVTRDMVLGLNAKRIGDILAKAGRAEDAAKSYSEAREYYEKAMIAFPDKDSKENKKIQASLKDIPKG